MARRYARDNRGRFAPKGSGATARGGRLKTASGKKRESQTMQASAAPKGTIGKPRGLKPAAATPMTTAAAASKRPSKRRRPTANESRAKGLMPISDIRARRAAASAASQSANASSYQRRLQSERTKAKAAEYQAMTNKPGRFSTIRNPAPEGSFPFTVTGSTWQGRQNAAQGRAARDAAPKRRVKTDTQFGRQANRAISSAYAQAARRSGRATTLEGKLAVQRRTQRRLNRIAGLAERRGLVRTVTGIEGFDNPSYRFRRR